LIAYDTLIRNPEGWFP